MCRNVLSSQEVVDFVSERIKPDESGNMRPLSSIVEEVKHCTHSLETAHITFNYIITTLFLYVHVISCRAIGFLKILLSILLSFL